MGLLNVIRHLALREKLAIREIARRTGLSRNTIMKHLNTGTIEPKFSIPERPSKLDPFADKLAGWLTTEASKSRKLRTNPGLPVAQTRDHCASAGWMRVSAPSI